MDYVYVLIYGFMSDVDGFLTNLFNFFVGTRDTLTHLQTFSIVLLNKLLFSKTMENVRNPLL